MNSNDANPASTDAEPEGPIHQYSAAEPEFALRNYWIMIVERKWFVILGFLICLGASVLITFLTPPTFQSFTLVQVLKRGAQALQVMDVVESTIASDTDFNTQTKLLESTAIAQSVVARLTPEELAKLTKPYAKDGSAGLSPVSVVMMNRTIRPQRLTFMIAIIFKHEDPAIAARIANLYAEEYIAYNSRMRVEESLRVVDDLKERADQQRRRVDEVANALHDYRKKENLLSLVQTKDIVTERLKALNIAATQTSIKRAEAEVRWRQVQALLKNGGDITSLSFISTQPAVAVVMQQATQQRLLLAQLKERYREKHPKLIEALNTLNQAEYELELALKTAANAVRAEHENAVRNDEDARTALRDQENLSLEMDRRSVEYDNLVRELRINEQILESMIGRMRETSINSTIESHGARIIDRAFEPIEPVSPKLALNLIIGTVAGLVFGVGLAYAIAMFDDRIKSLTDIESMLGLPLLGIIGRIDHMEHADKAQVVSNGAAPEIGEAFLSVYTSLRMTEPGRSAKVFMVTSSMPGEGKSLVSCNLSQVFASQGARTLLIDCDLRKPALQRCFNLPLERGLIQVCNGSLPLEEAIAANVEPNLDLLIAGGRAKNPVRLLNCAEFEALLGRVSQIYDCVILDTPPLGPVSDAFHLCPMVDGAIYVVHHAKVPRKLGHSCSRRLAATNVPILGVVLNGVDPTSATHRYSEYSDRSYKEYTLPSVPPQSQTS